MKLLPFELEMVQTLARALVPADALGGVTAAADVGARFDREVTRSPWHVALALRFSLWLAWLSPLWMMLRPHGFGGVDAEMRVTLLERLLKHRLYIVRMATALLKLTLCMATLGDSEVLRTLGAYDLATPAERRAS